MIYIIFSTAFIPLGHLRISFKDFIGKDNHRDLCLQCLPSVLGSLMCNIPKQYLF